MHARTCAFHVICCGCVPGSPCPSRPCGDPCQHTHTHTGASDAYQGQHNGMHAPATAATAATSSTSPAGTEDNACTLTGCGSSRGCVLCSCPVSPLLRPDPPHLLLVLLSLQACPLQLPAPQQAWPLSCPVLQRQEEAPRQAARLMGLSSSCLAVRPQLSGSATHLLALSLALLLREQVLVLQQPLQRWAAPRLPGQWSPPRRSSCVCC